MTTIAFAEDEYSQAMVDFAAALRTRGLRIVRLLADPTRTCGRSRRGCAGRS